MCPSEEQGLVALHSRVRIMCPSEEQGLIDSRVRIM